MVTRLLHCCGLELGPKSELMPPQADNPDGFWEHLGFVALNDQLLSELGGAWDLPPKANEDFLTARLDPLRLKARLLIEKFDSASVWGWKDPRNSLTLPFWRQVLPRLKTIVVVRNPLEVAHSMKERNGTSYSFGLRLWEIYNRRVIEAANARTRLVTHYDLLFDDPENELRRITDFIGLADAEVANAAALVTRRKRHTHFSIDDLTEARVCGEVIEFYRALVSEAKGTIGSTPQGPKQEEPDLLPGAVSQLESSVPERIVRIEHLEREIRQLSKHLAWQDELLLAKSVSLAESEARIEELRSRL